MILFYPEDGHSRSLSNTGNTAHIHMVPLHRNRINIITELRHYATSWKVMSLIPDVIGFFN
jgi:hypothetical protein